MGAEAEVVVQPGIPVLDVPPCPQVVSLPPYSSSSFFYTYNFRLYTSFFLTIIQFLDLFVLDLVQDVKVALLFMLIIT